ncbi:cellulase family glycosylhydrolase [Methylomonas methanica]|uniref:PA14 domain protein n=1 Tax=Methylomonas methanica (strain DSM 25384 / MC09) TaxID=857087 RepID=G0A238_METMM|nr:cellulase family glycosylhydrolase [Methylomonas methanica]AEG02581.1 PA14 domain protein [Methylomonas methanica MC09]
MWAYKLLNVPALLFFSAHTLMSKFESVSIFNRNTRIALLALIAFQSANAHTFHTSGSALLDPCGVPFVVRGVNAGIAFPVDNNADSLEQITRTGANAVRLTFRWRINRSNPDLVNNALQKAAENHLLAIPSIWDASGDMNKLDFAVNFWTQPEMVAVLRRYEDNLLLNIGNEIGGGDVSFEEFTARYAQAVQKIRDAGLHMPLVVDAAAWGRGENYLLENANALIESDPDHNLLFSWHPWDQSAAPDDAIANQLKQRFKATVDAAAANNIPLLVGEFSSVGAQETGHVPYQYMMEYADTHNVGWLWWWWSSGATPDKHALTTNGAFGSWANVGEEVAMTSPYGINATAKRTHYLSSGSCAPGTQLEVESTPNRPKMLRARVMKGAEVLLYWQIIASNEKNFDIEVSSDNQQTWKLVKVLGPDSQKVAIGAAKEYIYTLDRSKYLDPNHGYDPSLNYSTDYWVRVGAYRASNAVAYSTPIKITTNSASGMCANNSSGSGLYAQYFDARYSWPGFTTIDPQIDFDWGTGSPNPSDPTAPKDHFAVAWYGSIQPPANGEYTFYTNSDDFATVWIDGVKILDNSGAFANGWAVGKVNLSAKQKHSILVEYREWDNSASMALYWGSNQFERQLVPSCVLFPE